MHLTYQNSGGHTSPDRPSPEIEVTPEMIKAGVNAYASVFLRLYQGEPGIEETLVASIYQSMMRVRSGL